MFPLLYPPAIAPSHYPTISDRASKRAPHTPRLGLGYSAWSVRRQRGGGGIRWGNRRKIYLSATLSPKNSHNNGNSSLLCSRSYPIRYRSLQAQAQRHPHDYTYHLISVVDRTVAIYTQRRLPIYIRGDFLRGEDRLQ